MEVNIKIDDKYNERNLYLFAGVEPVARNKNQQGWEVKVAGCSRCGQCCKSINEKHPLGTEDGCRYLYDSGSEQLCGLGYPQLGLWRPHGCSIADPTWIEDCTVRWQRIK